MPDLDLDAPREMIDAELKAARASVARIDRALADAGEAAAPGLDLIKGRLTAQIERLESEEKLSFRSLHDMTEEVHDAFMQRQLRDDGAHYCGFCWLSQQEVKKLIAGPTIFICDECTRLCMSIIDTEDGADAPSGYFRLPPGQGHAGMAALAEFARHLEANYPGAAVEVNWVVGPEMAITIEAEDGRCEELAVRLEAPPADPEG
jgi:hypothetical protein